MLTKGFWIHDRFMDVFIEVMSYEGTHGNQDVYTIEWWNRGQESPYQIYERDMIGLAPEDYPHWRQYDPLTRALGEPAKYIEMPIKSEFSEVKTAKVVITDAACVCGEINARNCPIHQSEAKQDHEPEGKK